MREPAQLAVSSVYGQQPLKGILPLLCKDGQGVRPSYTAGSATPLTSTLAAAPIPRARPAAGVGLQRVKHLVV